MDHKYQHGEPDVDPFPFALLPDLHQKQLHLLDAPAKALREDLYAETLQGLVHSDHVVETCFSQSGILRSRSVRHFVLAHLDIDKSGIEHLLSHSVAITMSSSAPSLDALVPDGFPLLNLAVRRERPVAATNVEVEFLVLYAATGFQ